MIFVPAMPSDGKAYGHFKFTNTGAYAVRITGLKTTCGCTAATSEKRLIAPGEKGEVIVAFKTIGRRGLNEAPITVKTDDAATPETILKLRVLVKDLIELQPTFVYWKADEPLTPKTISVKVTNGFPVTKIDASSSESKVAVRVETIKAGSEYNLIVTPQETSERVKARLSIVPDYPADAPKTFIAFARVR